MRNKELFKRWLWGLRECGEVRLDENQAKEFRSYLDKIQFPYQVEWETCTYSNGHKADICYIQVKEG